MNTCLKVLFWPWRLFTPGFCLVGRFALQQQETATKASVRPEARLCVGRSGRHSSALSSYELQPPKRPCCSGWAPTPGQLMPPFVLPVPVSVFNGLIRGRAWNFFFVHCISITCARSFLSSYIFLRCCLAVVLSFSACFCSTFVLPCWPCPQEAPSCCSFSVSVSHSGCTPPVSSFEDDGAL